MNIRISLNEKHETFQVTAFLAQIYCYEHDVTLVFTKDDLLDKDQPASIENLPLPRHHLAYVDRVIYEDGKRATVLHEREVNKSGIRRKI